MMNSGCFKGPCLVGVYYGIETHCMDGNYSFTHRRSSSVTLHMALSMSQCST
jgi:hypothetical protein